MNEKQKPKYLDLIVITNRNYKSSDGNYDITFYVDNGNPKERIDDPDSFSSKKYGGYCNGRPPIRPVSFWIPSYDNKLLVEGTSFGSYYPSNGKIIDGNPIEKTEKVLEEVLTYVDRIREPNQFIVHWYGSEVRIEQPTQQNPEFNYNITKEDLRGNYGQIKDITKPETWNSRW